MGRWTTASGLGVGVGAALGGVYVGLVTGTVPIALGVGRRTRRLGPLMIDIAAPSDLVFDVIAVPYAGRHPRAMADKVRVLERGTDMVLAAHRTPVRDRLVATTVETGTIHAAESDRLPARPRAGAARRRDVCPHPVAAGNPAGLRRRAWH
jgi:hypothetical protein